MPPNLQKMTILRILSPDSAKIGYNSGMSTIVMEVYDALLAAGADEKKSRAAAQAVAHLDAGNYATKPDLEKLASKSELDDIRGDIRALDKRFVAVEDRLAAVEKDVGEIKVSIANLRSEIFKWGAAAVLALIASQTATAVLIVSLSQ